MLDSSFSGIARFCLVAIAGFACGAVSAATLVLKDGAVIRGDIKTLQDDVYTVETGSLGTLRIPKENVRTIDHDNESTQRSSGEESLPDQAELQAMQSRMAQNPGLLSVILALQSDPEIQAVLADPKIMNAIASGDYAALMNNPKIIALTNNAKVREVIEAAQ